MDDQAGLERAEGAGLATGEDISPHGELAKTALWELHIRHGGRMVAFAGYDLPAHYGGQGVLAEHLHTRSDASLFDIGHMGVVEVSGVDVGPALETILPASLASLSPGGQRYSFFTNESGGIIDDVIAGCDGDRFTIVVNASRKHDDIAHMRAALPRGVTVTLREDLTLVALQGPGAQAAAEPLLGEVATLGFMEAAWVGFQGMQVRVSRSGYTGEDGFEFALPVEHAEAFVEALLARPGVKLAGLGARDTLRLEAGLCLYGSDLDTTTTPVEAALTWAIPKARREAGGFPGDGVIRAQLQGGPPRRRVGLSPLGRRPIRGGTDLTDASGEAVGTVTSGTFGPSVGRPIGMGYVRTDLAVEGKELTARSGSRLQPTEVSALPFVPHRYLRS